VAVIHGLVEDLDGEYVVAIVFEDDEDAAAEENGRQWSAKNAKALNASAEAKTPTLMKADDTGSFGVSIPH
jgi:hypothetical protein